VGRAQIKIIVVLQRSLLCINELGRKLDFIEMESITFSKIQKWVHRSSYEINGKATTKNVSSFEIIQFFK